MPLDSIFSQEKTDLILIHEIIEGQIKKTYSLIMAAYLKD